MRLSVVVGDDVVHDLLKAGRGLHNLGRVNSFDLDILHLVLALHGSDVLDREFQDVFISDSIGDDIAMQAFSKEVFGCALPKGVLRGIVCEDRRSGKPEHLHVIEVVRDPLVGLSELAAVAFIEDEDHALVFERVHLRKVTWVADCRVELLQCCDDAVQSLFPCSQCRTSPWRICWACGTPTPG